MPIEANEAFSRVLIDKALEFSGWVLLDPHQVRFELNRATGWADYALCNQRGALAALEANCSPKTSPRCGGSSVAT
jgi:predicted type IV restriction endonuclease